MGARDRSRHRFEWKAPGERHWYPSALADRVLERESEPPPTRSCCGESAVVRVQSVRSNRRLADPGPNSPLLKRLIRNPKGLECGYSKRERIIDDRPRTHSRESFPRTMREGMEFRGEVVVGNPLRQFERSLPDRGRPSVSSWLAAGAA